MFKKQRGWETMQVFVAPNKFCHSAEAAVLDTLATRALICVEEVEVNSIAAALERYGPFHRAAKAECGLLVEHMK